MLGKSLILALLLLGFAAQAQQYPERSLRMIVVNPPGGGVDVIARLIAKPLSEKWNHPVVVDNRGGASGMIAGAAVAGSPADGYTLLMSASEVALNVALFFKMQYDPVKAFAPVTLIATTPMVLVTPPSLKTRTLKEFVSYVSERHGMLNYASGGNGTPQQFAMELLKLASRMDIAHVPYKSGGLQVVGILAGEVAGGFAALLPALPHIKSGRLNAIAVSSPGRSPSLPDVPSMVESGYPNFSITQWYAAWLPAGTPKPVIDKLAGAMLEIIRSPDFRARMIDLGAEAVGSTQDELHNFRATEIAKYKEIAAQASIKAE